MLFRSSSAKLKPNKYLRKLLGEQIGTGAFSTINVYTPDKRRIIKQSDFYKNIDKFKGDRSPETIKKINRLIQLSYKEPENTKTFSSLNKVFPKNILKVDHHSTCRTDDNYFQHNYIG